MLTCKFEDGGEGKLRHVTVHALAVKDGKLLLVKRSQNILEGGKWGLPGGFAGRDEKIRDSALRELKEETGCSGKIISLFRINSQPHRKNDDERQNIAMEFIVETTGEIGVYDKEQTEVKWFKLDEINLDEMAFDHGDTIKLLIDYQKSKFNLPIIA